VQALPPSVQPGAPSVCPPHIEPDQGDPKPPFSACLWPDLTLLFAGRGGDVRCEHGQTGQWRTMPHQRPGRASGANRPHARGSLAPARCTATRPPPDAAVPSERWDGSAERPRPALPGHGGGLRSECRTYAASTAAPDCCSSCASGRAHLGVARRVAASIRGGGGGVGLNVGEHAAAVPAREGPYQP
jgi:hypothetical protein